MKDQIENNFKQHDLTDLQRRHTNMIRVVTKELAQRINDICPDSREKSIALTKLEEVMMWANASIARNEGK